VLQAAIINADTIINAQEMTCFKHIPRENSNELGILACKFHKSSDIYHPLIVTFDATKPGIAMIQYDKARLPQSCGLVRI
jgi:hypothetical protein